MKWIIFLLLSITSIIPLQAFANDTLLKQSYESKQSNVQIRGNGKVIRILPDDNDGSKHQKFIIKLGNGQTLLVAHNIDLAPRVSNLKKGDEVEFYGEYEWSRKGGVMHWTHKDPAGKHIDGWLKHNGETYW